MAVLQAVGGSVIIRDGRVKNEEMISNIWGPVKEKKIHKEDRKGMAGQVSGVPDVRGRLASGTEWLTLSHVSRVKLHTLKNTPWISGKEDRVDLD